MSSVNRYNYVTKTATRCANSWSNVDKVRFHCFNPNGAVAKKNAMNNCLATFVNAGVIPSGWHIAYGTFADYHYKAMFALLEKKRVRNFDVNYHAKRLINDSNDTYIKLGEEILS